MASGLRTITDNMAQVMRSVNQLVGKDVLVGIPASDAPRKDDEPITNAELGYIHEFGSPANNIPARPALIPGVVDAQAVVSDQLRKAAVAALDGRAAQVDVHLNRAGLLASNAVKARINAGIGPALSESTLRARARRGRKGAAQELANRAIDPANESTDLAKPLIDTAQYRNSFTYVIRKK